MTAHRLALLLLLPGTLLSACRGGDEPGTGDDTGTGDTGEEEGDAPWFCGEGTMDVVSTSAGAEIETEHYRLHFDAAVDVNEAMNAAALAEAAYAAMTDYFGAEPPDLPLEAGWYGDFAAFQAAIEADGTAAPAAGGYYWPGASTAYMYTQPTIYYSRVLFLHELVHQFHFLARTGNTSRAAWYAEGLAEYLSRHDWEDACVRLGRLPMLTWEDAPAEALAEGSYTFDGESDLSRPWAWATTKYLQDEEPAAFDAFRDSYDSDSSTLLSDYVDIADTVAAVEAWLPLHQEPMKPIYYDWVHVSDGVVWGEGPYFSMAISKQTDSFAASHAAPIGYAGIVAAYNDSSNYSAWLVGADGGLWTFVAIEGAATWWYMDAAPIADAFTWELSGATVTVNGVSYEETSGFQPRGGIALYGDKVQFEDILP